MHMDGARIWNAAASSNLPLSRIVAGVDSVSVCYSKGETDAITAPAGRLLLRASATSRLAKAQKPWGVCFKALLALTTLRLSIDPWNRAKHIVNRR